MEPTLSSILINKLFSVIRCGLELDTEVPELSAEDCAAILSIGKRQSIQPIIYRGLVRCSAPAEAIRDADKARMRQAYLVVQFSEAMKSIAAALDKCGLPYVPLKGSVIRDLYPLPELRTSSDIDVLVREEDLDRAVQELESQTDFKTMQRDYHDISMVNARVHLELHFTLKHNAENIDRLLANAWDYAVPTGSGSCWTFTPEFQIFHVIAHMSKHFTNGGLGIRPFIDLWLLRHKTGFDENAVREMCAECSILTFYEECCTLSEVWLGKEEHTETSSMLEDFCLSGGVYGSDHFNSAGKRRTKKFLPYIASRIFPPLSEVKAYYPEAEGRSAAYYYGRRLTSWLSHGRREELKNKFNDILTTEPEYLDSVDELFKRLGM